MNEKEMLAWARANPQAKPTATVDDAHAQLSDEEMREAQRIQAEMKLRGIKNAVTAVVVLQGEAAEKQRKLQEGAASRQVALADDAVAKAEEDAEFLAWVNEWRLEDGLPTIGYLHEAAQDERDAAESSDVKLLRRRQTALR